MSTLSACVILPAPSKFKTRFDPPLAAGFGSEEDDDPSELEEPSEELLDPPDEDEGLASLLPLEAGVFDLSSGVFDLSAGVFDLSSAVFDLSLSSSLVGVVPPELIGARPGPPPKPNILSFSIPVSSLILQFSFPKQLE